MATLAAKGEGEGSNECSKVPPVDHQIHVRASLPLLEANQDKDQQLEILYRTVPRRLMDVFSVRFVKFDKQALSQMYGCIMIGSFPTYVLYSRKHGEPLNVHPNGLVMLRDPDEVIQPSDRVGFYPCLFRYQAGADQFKDFKPKLLWNRVWEDFDTLLCTRVRCQFGKLKVKYAVYECGVTAHVVVTLTDCRFPSANVHGWIIAHNSKVGEAGKIFLFKMSDSEGISIGVSHCERRIAQLPLARCKIAVPVDSSFTIAVNIWQCSAIDAPDQVIAKNKDFKFDARLSGQEVQTFRGDACHFNVGVTWSR
ncbi:rRNA N-glycosidase [Rhynchospora pubera]|uniref:rRNA N-glycosidase n=1 Tax=Rhynchospora pubera TaxID=906938 RepID=A0AAV8ASY5_9POAL|nr:rRNA N-glycosidase [Rhynchospora pubera]KAJ4757332.1 rRNA N-glycosidase [Rhynchospora pubera]